MKKFLVLSGVIALASAFGLTEAANAGFIIAEDIAAPASDTTRPGRPGIAFDGTNYLVVSCRDIVAPTGIFGTIVSPDSMVLDTFHINPADCSSFATPDVAFDGTNFLVIFKRFNQLIGIRVTPAGTVLDSPNGFIIGSTTAPRSIGFDGENYLVVFSMFMSGSHDIFGVRVTPGGQVLDGSPIPIFQGAGEQISPTIAFDGNNYLVVWEDTPTGSGPSTTTEITGARITPQGFILDPIGIPISTASKLQGEPHVTFAAGNYFVVWVDRRNDPSTSATPAVLDIFGTRITPNGELLDGASDTGGIAINTFQVDTFPSSLKVNPRVGFDGKHYLAVWQFEGFVSPAGIYAARVSTNGVLVDGPPDDTLGILISEPSCFACRLVFPNIHSSIQTSLVAWINNAEQLGTAKDVLGAIVLSDPETKPEPKPEPKSMPWLMLLLD